MASEYQTDPPDAQPVEIEPAPCPREDPEFSVSLKPASSPRPWGPWATIGWTLLCIVVMSAAQIAGLIIIVAVGFATNRSVQLNKLFANGDVLALGTLLGTPAIVGPIAFLVRVRRYPVRDYLALTWPPVRSVLIACAGLAVLLCTSDLISYLLGRPLVPPVMVDVYRAAWLPALLLALVVLAPLGEETLFRGFLFEGIATSRAGPVVAILVSSVAWALLHVQYDWYGIVSIAVIGLYLGVVRYRTASVLVTMLLHALSNAGATLEMVVQEHWLK